MRDAQRIIHIIYIVGHDWRQTAVASLITLFLTDAAGLRFRPQVLSHLASLLFPAGRPRTARFVMYFFRRRLGYRVFFWPTQPVDDIAFDRLSLRRGSGCGWR